MAQNPVNANQVSIGATPTLLAAYNGNRMQLTINNAGGATVYLGPSGVATATGLALANNATLQLNGPGAIYGIVAASTNNVSFLET
jgi:hypothetical protein